MVDLKLPKKRSLVSNAPVWKRVAAFIIDVVIVQFIVIGPFSGALQSSIPVSSDFTQNYEYLQSNPGAMSQLSTIMFVVFALVFLYAVLFELRLGQTPGRMIMNLYLIPEKKNDKIDLMKVVLRNLYLIPMFPFNLLWIVDPIYLAISGRRLSDVFSKTKIVEEINI